MIQDYPQKRRYAIYVLGGLPFLPHYRQRGLYVAPGYRQNGLAYTPRQLIEAKAKREYWDLWDRGFKT